MFNLRAILSDREKLEFLSDFYDSIVNHEFDTEILNFISQQIENAEKRKKISNERRKLKKQQEKALAYGKVDDFDYLRYFVYAGYVYSHKEEHLYNIILANKWKESNGFISTSSFLKDLLDNENASFYTKQTLYDMLVDFMIRGGLLGFPDSNDMLYTLKKEGADYYKNFVADSLSEHMSPYMEE